MRLDRSLLVIAGGVTAAIHVGKLPPALPALREALGVSLVQAGFLISMVQFAAMTLGLAVGLAADGLGLRRVMVGGLLLASAASVAGGLTTDPLALLALRALEGLGFLLAVTPAPSLIRRFVASSALPARLGLWGAYMPLGTSLALLAGPAWIAAAGWSAWWWLTATLSGAMALALWLGLPPDPPPAAREPGAWRGRLGDTLRAPGPWLVSLAFAAYSSQWLSVVGFLPTIYAQAGLAPAAAGLATALAAGVNMIGNIAAGRLLQRGVPPQRLLQAGFGTMGLGGLLLFAPVWPAGPLSAIGPYLAVLAFSAVGGLVPGTLFSQAVRVAPGPGAVSTTVGWMQQWSSFGQFAGPPLVAWVASRTGGWSFSWGVTGACALAGLWLAGRLGRLVKSAG
ncbi:MFS transporter [Ramlibacter sp. MAHUQ-53]|uniref:MFS transporter n=1 Tax=unclassified Ramlibacter TaxID=2617605 RepID=UPI0036314BE2